MTDGDKHILEAHHSEISFYKYFTHESDGPQSSCLDNPTDFEYSASPNAGTRWEGPRPRLGGENIWFGTYVCPYVHELTIENRVLEKT